MQAKKDEPSVWRAALDAKCPRCRTGAMFVGDTYGLKPQKMNEYCPHCLLKFEQRPGHFYVSMFISYAMSVAETIAACLATFIIVGDSGSVWLYLTVVFIAIFALAPFNYRYSRVILLFWLTPGIRYNPELAENRPIDKTIDA